MVPRKHGVWGLPAEMSAGLLCLSVLLGAPSDGHAALKCPLEPVDPKIKVVFDPGKVTYKTNYSRYDLARLHNVSDDESSSGWIPVGYTQARVAYGVQTQARTVKIASHRYCAALTGATIQIGFDSLLVYVAREYPKWSCRYDVTLEHEHEHIAIFRETLKDWLPTIRRTMKKAALRVRPEIASKPEIALRDLQDQLLPTLKLLVKEIQADQDERNAEIDTEENYRYEQSRCSEN